MIFDGLSKINKNPYTAILKLVGLLLLAQFTTDCVVFLKLCVLDCVYNRILQCFHKSQRINLEPDL